MSPIQRINDCLLYSGAVLLLLMATMCRDFEDTRTPYKPSVRVKFTRKDNKKRFKLEVTEIKSEDGKTHYEAGTKRSGNANLGVSFWDIFYKSEFDLPLDYGASSKTFVIESNAPTSPDRLTITYRQRSSLISHKTGGQCMFILESANDILGGTAKILNKELSDLNEQKTDVEIFY